MIGFNTQFMCTSLGEIPKCIFKFSALNVYDFMH